MISVPPLVLLVVMTLIAVVISLLVATKRASSRRKLTGPVCVACGYSVIGLTEMTCPECGSDLRAAGILNPGMPQGRDAGAGVMTYTILLGFVAIVAASGMESVVPVRHSYKREVRLGPMLSGYGDVVVQTSRSSWSGRFVPAAVVIELEQAGATSTALPAQMTLHADGGFEFTSAGSRVFGRGEFGESSVLEWLKAMGIDTTAAEVQHKVARIVAEARVAARSGRAAINQSSTGFSSRSFAGGDPTDVFQNYSLNQSGGSYSPAGSARTAMLLFWLAVWIWGLRYLVRPKLGVKSRAQNLRSSKRY